LVWDQIQESEKTHNLVMQNQVNFKIET